MIYFGVILYNDVVCYVDNCMVVLGDVELTSLPYIGRNPVSLESPYWDHDGQDFEYTTPADTNYHETYDGTADTDPNVNRIRPAWANILLLTGYGYNGTHAQLGYIRPAGSSSNWPELYIHGETYGPFVSPVHIGKDGQLEYKVSHTDVHLRWNITNYRGCNL
jgi:hypothetical protein